ncbi:TetR/AcrR family transcriptional regulator [Pseudonocardiaceae bacterium YIM PH 21723]|nr:TetR/AcrR family transcriptional regulator [Pseudonocardiaceae bacterium YIM PH 21723]
MKRPYGGVNADDRRAERRAKLLLAAMKLFADRGFQRTKITELCTEAGVSTRNFYEEFEKKEDVLLVLHDTINATAMHQIRARLSTVEDAGLETRIGVLVGVFVDSVTANPRAPRLVYVEAVGVNAELEAQHQQWVAKWARFIQDEAQRGVDRGEATRRDYRLTAYAMVGAITGLLREWQAHEPPLDTAEVTAEIKAMLLSALTR